MSRFWAFWGGVANFQRSKKVGKVHLQRFLKICVFFLKKCRGLFFAILRTESSEKGSKNGKCRQRPQNFLFFAHPRTEMSQKWSILPTFWSSVLNACYHERGRGNNSTFGAMMYRSRNFSRFFVTKTKFLYMKNHFLSRIILVYIMLPSTLGVSLNESYLEV